MGRTQPAPANLAKLEAAVVARSKGPAAAIAALLACALVAGAIAAGLWVPGLSILSPFRPEPALDYEAGLRSPLAPLRAEFIREVLGGTSPTESRLDAIARREAAARSQDDLDFAPPRPPDIHPFTNDSMDNARTITALPYTAKTKTAQAGREPGEPDDCGSVGGTAWYRYQATRDESLTANTFGTDHPITLGVFRSSGTGRPTLVACDSDVEGNALVQFDSVKGVTYLFQVTSQAGGNLVFTVEPEGVTTLVSRTPSGEPASGDSAGPSISSDGRYVAFFSYATDLVPGMEPAKACPNWNWGDIPLCAQVYVAERSTGRIQLMSLSSQGIVGNGHSDQPWVSGDGRYVAFRSWATNLVPGDTNGDADVFVRDMRMGLTERVSVSSQGAQANPRDPRWDPMGTHPSMSEDGRFVVFSSNAENLVESDRNNLPDVFIHDRRTHETELVSVSSSGEQAEWEGAPSWPVGDDWATYHRQLKPSISPNGRYVLFFSDAENLVPNDNNKARDLFLHDRLTSETEIVSLSWKGEQASHPEPANHTTGYTLSARPLISADGRYVTFSSPATNLVRDPDTNSARDIFVRDRFMRTTLRVSVSSSGEQANGDSFDPAIVGSGRYVIFSSYASNLTPASRTNRTGVVEDIYVHDLVTRTTTRIPVAPSGSSGAAAAARDPGISADGRVITFYTPCLDLCSSNTLQVWVHERPIRPA